MTSEMPNGSMLAIVVPEAVLLTPLPRVRRGAGVKIVLVRVAC